MYNTQRKIDATDWIGQVVIINGINYAVTKSDHNWAVLTPINAKPNDIQLVMLFTNEEKHTQ